MNEDMKEPISRGEAMTLLERATGAKWDGNGKVENAVNIALLNQNVNELKEDEKESKSARFRLILWAVGLALVMVSGMLGTWQITSSKISVQGSQIMELKESLRLQAKEEQHYRDILYDRINVISTELATLRGELDGLKNFTETEIGDRKEYYARLEQRVTELQKELTKLLLEIK